MSKRNLSVLSLIAAAILGVIAFYAGRFTAKFDENQCYSKVISKISTYTIDAINQNNTGKDAELIKKLNEIPNNGYESNCADILKSLD